MVRIDLCYGSRPGSISGSFGSAAVKVRRLFRPGSWCIIMVYVCYAGSVRHGRRFGVCPVSMEV